MKLVMAAILIAAAVPLVAQAQDTQSSSKTHKAVDPNKRICKDEEETGSRFTKSVCHTRAEWDAMALAANTEAKEDLRRRATKTSEY
jgi:hypothetical protein